MLEKDVAEQLKSQRSKSALRFLLWDQEKDRFVTIRGHTVHLFTRGPYIKAGIPNNGLALPQTGSGTYSEYSTFFRTQVPSI